MTGRTERWLDRKVDLHRELKSAFGVESLAAERLIQDGQIQIDGHVVLPQWSQGHWSVRQLTGRMLTIPHIGRATRLFQSAP